MLARLLAVVAAIAMAAFAFVLARAPLDSEPAAAPTHVAAPETAPPATPARIPRQKRPAPAPEPTATATPAPPPPSVPTSTDPAMARASERLTRLLGQPKVGGPFGIAVLDSQGGPVYGRSSTTPLIPASTQKLAVAGAALATFGPQHRYTTTVTTTASISRGGILRGNLVLVGDGDPALAQPAFAAVEPDRPRTPLDRLAADVKRAGVRKINGRVLGDPTVLAHQPAAAGWPGRYFDNLDATRISGLTVDGGRALYRSGGALRATAADDPAEQAATVFARLLRERGIKVTGKPGVVGRPSPAGTQIASVDSPPLRMILRYMVQRSDNHFADTVFRTIGAAKGDSTWIGAAGGTAEALAGLQLDWTDVVLADGSGLSRANRVSPLFLAQLQGRMWASNLQEEWAPLMAITGTSGTLRSRLSGTVAQGRVYGKTGTLRDVTALVGTVVGTEGRMLHFAAVGNDLPSTARMREVTDKAVLVMAEELQDCRRVTVRAPKNKRKPARQRPARVRLVCG